MSQELEIATLICKLLQKKGHQAVFDGGCVRDSILGIDYNDIDIATSASFDVVHSILYREGFLLKDVGQSFGVVIARRDGFEFEIATFRKDVDCDGRHPGKVEKASMEEDSSRRDFTINSIFFDPIKEEYIDFNNGIEDVKNKVLRFVGNPQERIKEDYLRLLRFIRFWAKGFIPSEEDIAIANEMSCKFNDFVAPDRVSKEFMEKMLSHSVASGVFENLRKLPNLFDAVFPDVVKLKGCPQNPEYHPEGDAFNHTMLVVDNLISLGARPKLILAGLFHDIGKADTTSVDSDGRVRSAGHEKVSSALTHQWMKHYRFPNATIEYVSGIVADHMKLHYSGIKTSTLRKIMAESYFDDLIIMVKADIMSSSNNFSVFEEYMKQIEEIEKTATRVLPKPLVRGDTLLSMGLEPGPDFKKILDAAMEQQLEGKIKTEDEGILFVRSFLPKL